MIIESADRVGSGRKFKIKISQQSDRMATGKLRNHIVGLIDNKVTVRFCIHVCLKDQELAFFFAIISYFTDWSINCCFGGDDTDVCGVR